MALGLGIGRLVFRALNTVEVVLAAALITALLTITPGVAGWTLLVVTVALLATQTVCCGRVWTGEPNRSSPVTHHPRRGST